LPAFCNHKNSEQTRNSRGCKTISRPGAL